MTLDIGRIDIIYYHYYNAINPMIINQYFDNPFKFINNFYKYKWLKEEVLY